MHFWKPLIIIPAITFTTFSFAYLFYTWRRNIKTTKKLSHIVETSPLEKYIDQRNRAFLRMYMESTHDYNSSVEPEFYNKEKYNDIMKQETNVLETAWKRRILFEATPRGNIALFYDPFKQGFAYYSDQHIPYAILNAAAMKYVCTFRCRDFFMDEQFTPEYCPSTLLSIRIQEEKKEAADKKTKIGTMLGTKSGPFAKFKNYTKVSDPIAASIAPKKNINMPKIAIPVKETKGDREYARNKFIHLGKMANWTLLEKRNRKVDVSVNASDVMAHLDSNPNAQKQVFNYRDFKKLNINS